MKHSVRLLAALLCILFCFAACGKAPADSSAAPETTTMPDLETSGTDTDPIIPVEDKLLKSEKAYLMRIKDGATGIVTIVHDDGTLDTGKFLVNEFERLDLRGTVAMQVKAVVTTDGVKNKARIQEWQSYFDTGRLNLACHSWTHQFWGITDKAESGVYINNSGKETPFDFKDGNITFETKGAKEMLIECFPNEKVKVFVKPGFGKYIDENGKSSTISDTARAIIKENFIGMRMGGTSTQSWPVSDPFNITSYQVSLKHSLEDWTAQVDAAAKYGRWIVFMFHDIIPDASVTSTTSTLKVKQSTATGLFEHIANKVENDGLWCAYLDEAIMYSAEYRASEGKVETYSNRIEITLTSKLDTAIYDYPLTVRVSVPADWGSVTLTQADGTTETLTSFADGSNTYVYANVVPDGNTAILTKGE